MDKKKVVSLGDYVKKLDNVVEFDLMMGGEIVSVPVRVKTPTSEDEYQLMELIIDEFGQEIEELQKYETSDIWKVDPKDRERLLRFGQLQLSCLISSSCFEVDIIKDENGDNIINPVQPDNPKKMWATGPDCLKGCPRPLTKQLEKYLDAEGLGRQITEIEAGK